MANQIDIIKQIDKELEKLISTLKDINTEIVNTSKNAREISGAFNNVKTPKGLSDELNKTSKSTEQVVYLTKEREKVEKSLISTLAKREIAEESNNKSLIKNRFELQQQTKLIKESIILSSRYSSELQKATVIRNKLAKTIQDLNLKRELGNKLSLKEQNLLKTSAKEFDKYDKAIKKAKTSVGRFQENVGNYPKLIGGITSLTTALIGSFGVIEGLRLAFDFGKEAVKLAREAKGVEFAFKDLGYEGQQAFENIKKSTRGALSDLDIKKSLNEFKNFNISLEQTDVLFEFLAVRAAQTGKSVDSLRDSLVEGLAKESKLRIDNLGISVKDLNDELKKAPDFVTAVANIAKTEIAEAGNILDDAANSQEKFNAAFENFKVSAGSGFIGKLTNQIYELGASLIELTTDVNDASDSTLELFANLGFILKGQGGLVKAYAEQKRIDKDRKGLISEILTLQKEQGLTEGLLVISRDKLNKSSKDELTNLLKSLQLKNKEKEVTKESVQFLEEKIRLLKEEQKGLTINDLARSKSINNEIKQTQKLIDLILKGGEVKDRLKAKPIKIFEFNEKDAEIYIKAFKETFKKDKSFELPKVSQESIDNFQRELNEKLLIDIKVKIAQDTIKEGLNDLAGTIEEFTGVSGDKFLDFFDKISAKGEKTFEDFADIAASSFALAGDVSDAFFQGKIDQYEKDIEANNEYYSNLLENENLTDEERGRLELDRRKKEEELRKKQNKEKQKQFQLNKAFRIGEIIADTAQSIVKTGATLGYPAAIPFQIQAGILGAAQLAIVAAQPVPKFAEGGEMTHDGLMMINDHSSGRLEVVERDGKLLMTDKKNALVEGKKGDIIHKDAKEYFSKLSNDELIKNLNNHTMIATLRQQNYLIDKLDNKNVIQQEKINTDRIVKAINSKKTRFNLNQVITIEEDLKKLQRGNTSW